MTCADYQRKLSAYADGELTRWTRWKVHVHVSQCPDCSQLMAELQEADVMMAGFIAETPAPAYVTDAIMRRPRRVVRGPAAIMRREHTATTRRFPSRRRVAKASARQEVPCARYWKVPV